MLITYFPIRRSFAWVNEELMPALCDRSARER